MRKLGFVTLFDLFEVDDPPALACRLDPTRPTSGQQHGHQRAGRSANHKTPAIGPRARVDNSACEIPGVERDAYIGDRDTQVIGACDEADVARYQGVLQEHQPGQYERLSWSP